MATRLFALLSGLFLTIAGIGGFIPKFVWQPELARSRMEDIRFHGGYLLGVLAVNWPHNILWLVIGMGGLVAASNYLYSKMYAQGLFVVATVMTITGLLPLGINTLWGFLPMSGWNVLIHAILAIAAWYYGFVYTYERDLRMAQ